MLSQANSDPAPTDTGRSRRLVPESNGSIDRQILLRVASHVSIVRTLYWSARNVSLRKSCERAC